MTEWILDVIGVLGYVGIGLLMVLECVFPPIPSELVLPAAGFAVERGELGVVGVLIASTAGSLAGALGLYALGRIGGRPLVVRYASALRLRTDDLDRAERWFTRRGEWMVAGGRMVPAVRSLVSLPAGLFRMPVLRFVVLTAVGSAAWNALLVGLGWALGASWESVSGPVGIVARVVLVVLVVVVAAAAWWWLRRSARVTQDGDPQG